MALNYTTKYTDLLDKFDIDIKDYAIGGKLVTAKFMIADYQAETMGANHIKQTLLYQMVDYIMENKLVEFTKIPDMYNGASTYVARCYLAPDEQVKILRKYK